MSKLHEKYFPKAPPPYAPPRGKKRQRPSRAVLDRAEHYCENYEDLGEGDNEQTFPSPAGLAEHLDVPKEVVLDWVEKGRDESEAACAEFRDLFLRMKNVMERYLAVGAVEGHLGTMAKLLLAHEFQYAERQHVIEEKQTEEAEDYSSMSDEEAARRYRELIGSADNPNVVPMRDRSA